MCNLKSKPMTRTWIPGILMAILFCSLTVAVSAQKPPEKFGKITSYELENNSCPIDSSAHAYFIFDFGNSYFEYAATKISSNDAEGNRKGFQLYFIRHFRLKIVDNKGFSWADIEIPLYHDNEEEEVTTLKAYTYNLVDGKIEKTKLDKKDVYTEETGKYWKSEKFAMPNVKDGSVGLFFQPPALVLSEIHTCNNKRLPCAYP